MDGEACTVDCYKQDIPDGIAAEVQGLWALSVEGLRADDPGRPYWHFEGNRVRLLYPEGGMLVERGSDNFRPVGGCTDPEYDMGGRAVELGPGVFGPDGDMPLCWDVLRADADSLVYKVMQETLRLDRVDAARLGAAAPRANPAPRGRVTASSPLAPLQGDWVSVDDPASGLRINGDRFTFLHDGKARQESGMDVVDSCSARRPGTTLSAIVLRDAGDACYTVVTANRDQLELAPDTGRGNTLAFTRP